MFVKENPDRKKNFFHSIDARCFISFRQHMQFNDLNKSTIVEFTEESSDDEDVDNAADSTYTQENLGAYSLWVSRT